MSTAIKTVIHAQGFSATPAIRDHLMRRFTLSLQRFKDRIIQVDVFMKDLNGTGKRGEDQSVLVTVSLRGQGKVVTETISHDLYIALSLAARRTHRVVNRTLKRHDRIDRRTISQPYLPSAASTEMA